MAMREVRVYDGDFPTFDQMLAGDPTAVFPKEIWLQQVQIGEFAVRYKDFKTGLARSPAGEPVQSSEICRVFSSLEEARADSREVAKKHWTVRCLIYDHTGSQLDAVTNTKEVSKFALVVYAGILLWAGMFAIFGMGVIWALVKIALLMLGPFPSVQRLLSSLSWLGWTVYVFAGLLVGIAAWLLKLRFVAQRRVNKIRHHLDAVISPEEKKRFAELETLHGSKDPAERARFLKLAAEYRERISTAVKE